MTLIREKQKAKKTNEECCDSNLPIVNDAEFSAPTAESRDETVSPAASPIDLHWVRIRARMCWQILLDSAESILAYLTAIKCLVVSISTLTGSIQWPPNSETFLPEARVPEDSRAVIFVERRLQSQSVAVKSQSCRKYSIPMNLVYSQDGNICSTSAKIQTSNKIFLEFHQ
jgi:hypothetical protein